MFPLVLQFPFKLYHLDVQQTVKVNVERKENLVSFALKYKYPISIENAVCVSVSYTDNLFVYVFKFNGVNEAIEFIENKTVKVKKDFNFPNVNDLVEKNNKLMLEYERNEKVHNRRKKRRVKDSEGFIKIE